MNISDMIFDFIKSETGNNSHYSYLLMEGHHTEGRNTQYWVYSAYDSKENAINHANILVDYWLNAFENTKLRIESGNNQITKIVQTLEKGGHEDFMSYHIEKCFKNYNGKSMTALHNERTWLGDW